MEARTADKMPAVYRIRRIELPTLGIYVTHLSPKRKTAHKGPSKLLILIVENGKRTFHRGVGGPILAPKRKTAGVGLP